MEAAMGGSIFIQEIGLEVFVTHLKHVLDVVGMYA